MIIDGKEVELKNIPGYEGEYAASYDGHIYSYKRKKFLGEWLNGWGYHIVTVCHNGKNKNYAVHRLVALTWIPNPDNLPQVDHKDMNKSNNSVLNLRWVTQSENQKNMPDEVIERKRKHGKEIIYKAQAAAAKASSKPVVRVDRTTGQESYYSSAHEAARALGDARKNSPILACCNGNALSAYGSLWFFANDWAKIKADEKINEALNRKTGSEAMAEALGRPVVRIDKATNEETVYPSEREAARRVLGDVNKAKGISRCCRGELKSSYGSYWRYVQPNTKKEGSNHGQSE